MFNQNQFKKHSGSKHLSLFIFYIRMDIDWQGMEKTLQVGDWKLLYILSKNMESMAYEEFLHEFSRLHKKDWQTNDGTEKKPILTA